MKKMKLSFGHLVPLEVLTRGDLQSIHGGAGRKGESFRCGQLNEYCSPFDACCKGLTCWYQGSSNPDVGKCIVVP